MTIEQRTAMVERPVACSGRGQYIALVHYGSQGGRLYRSTFKYSHKDPRYKGEAAVLQDISHMVSARYREFIVAISVIKRCLHPKSHSVPRANREPHIERVFSWVVQHENSVGQTPLQAKRLQATLDERSLQPVVLPYTAHELEELPVKRVVTTNYWDDVYASVGMRGVERTVTLEHLLARAV
jgi:hypothetical protein